MWTAACCIAPLSCEAATFFFLESALPIVKREAEMKRGRSGRQRASEGGGDNWIISTIEWWGARGAANGGRDVLFSEANCSEKSWAFVQGGPATFPVHLHVCTIQSGVPADTRSREALWNVRHTEETHISPNTHTHAGIQSQVSVWSQQGGVQPVAPSQRSIQLREKWLSWQTAATRTHCFTVPLSASPFSLRVCVRACPLW